MKKICYLFIFALCAMSLTCCEKEDIKPDEEDVTTDEEDNYGNTTKPTASFQYARHSSFTVDFTNTSINATSYKWNFGDGSTSTETNPSHTYVSIGTKYVTLTAYNKNNSSKAYAHIIMTSTIKMVNTSNHTYKIYVDGIDKGNISGGYYQEYDVNPGEHTVRALQQDGYTFWATDETYDFECTAGMIYTYEFPDSSLGKSVQK